MTHRINGLYPFISTEECVYWHFSCGNLKHRTLVSIVLSLRKFFYSDSQGCLPIAVHNETAFATTVNGIVLAVVGWVHRTASRTPFARMVGVNVTQGNARVDAAGDDSFPE